MTARYVMDECWIIVSGYQGQVYGCEDEGMDGASYFFVFDDRQSAEHALKDASVEDPSSRVVKVKATFEVTKDDRAYPSHRPAAH